MSDVQFRRAARADMDWLYQTFRLTMQSYIAKTWGWDELFQHHSFHDNLPPSSFTIASVDEVDLGAYSVLEKKDHHWLEMVLVLPQKQNAGLGSQLLQRVQQRARDKSKPVRLSVLRVNPALRFYQRLGFEITGEDSWSYKLEWPVGASPAPDSTPVGASPARDGAPVGASPARDGAPVGASPARDGADGEERVRGSG